MYRPHISGVNIGSGQTESVVGQGAAVVILPWDFTHYPVQYVGPPGLADKHTGMRESGAGEDQLTHSAKHQLTAFSSSSG